MKKNLVAAAQSIIITTVLAISFTFAQSSMSTSTEEGLGFFGDMSIRVYCTFSDFVPGSDNSLCSTDIFINDKSTDALTEESETSPLSETKTNQINSVISQGLTGAARVVYVPVKGDKGDAGTTTIVYETKLAGQVVSPAAYVYAGGNTNTNPFQTTVPGDIYSTFIHFLQSEVIRFQSMFGTSAEIANILASTTVTTDLYFQGATGTNLTATGTIYAENLIATNSTSTNLFSTNASLTNSTSTNFFSVLANIWDLIVNNATITNATTTNLSGTNAVLTNLTGTSATITDATTTTLFANKASITEATTTYFFAAWANFLNLYVSNLSFTNATGTNLQVANASTTNFSATGTSVITNLYGDTATFTSASSTNLFTTLFKALNATIDNLATTNATITNSTSTKIFSTNASITNASTTNLFATSANTLSLIATNATLTNATITNLRVVNCAEGNVICNGGNDTGAVVGPDPVLTIGTLNAGNIEFITGDTGFPSVTPGAAKLIIETGVAGDGNGDVRVAQTLKVGENIVASGTITTTNLVATGTSVLTNLNSTSATITNATTTNLFASLFRALNGSIDGLASVNATLTSATTTNFRVTNIFAALTSTLTNLLFTNATGTNATTTNFFSSAFKSTNSTIDNLISASSTLSNVNLLSGNATLTSVVSTNSTSTNIFATIGRILNFNFLNATGTNLTATGTSNLANIISASSTLTNVSIISGRAVLSLATITSATTTGASYVGGVATFNDDVTINNQINVDAGTLFVNDVDERVGINTATPITTANVRLTVFGDMRLGISGTNGCVQRFDGTGIAGTCSSDENLKTNIVDMMGGEILEKISQIRFVSYSWNDLAKEKYSRSTDTKNLGVLAQNIEGIFPELVSTDEEGYKQVNITDLQWYLFSAIKELITKVNSLNTKVQTNELCIGSECISEQDLRDFKAWKQGNSGGQAPANPPAPEGNQGEESDTPEPPQGDTGGSEQGGEATN